VLHLSEVYTGICLINEEKVTENPQSYGNMEVDFKEMGAKGIISEWNKIQISSNFFIY
jgi:predicted house-cleaning NTP pyrophosphatase (Maf/HAM1 superfamily)